ncbi:MAG: TIGR01777 family protein [Kiritimatiellaceae bacterium]|nr:TIGR01777 family protein [Kiritimatiellaceae bacterium]RZO83469.1 MAG: TIGR01777 family protein [Kiritimatiellaceae bacterium]|tara:strand:- start:5117 stop:5971 length:855 start_codon:yes stop_codon:yes gene_type:complete
MNIYLSGSNGLVGTAVKKAFEAEGHSVTGLGRDFSKPLDFQGVDAVIHLAGENIAEGRWNAAKKARIKDSRLIGTRKLAEQLAQSEHKPSVFISASATGFYGDTGSETITETSAAGTGFLPEVCVEWEASTQPAEEAGIRTVHLRTGIVMSKKGGALKKMLPPFLLGGGGILGTGKQYMSWITLADMVGAIRFAMENDSLSGPVNLTAPNPVDNKEFTKILGRVIKRPTIAPLPGFAAKLIFGEMADAILLSGTKVLPTKLTEAGYSFTHATLEPALQDVMNEK